MKKLLFIALVTTVIVTGCSQPKGQLVGIYGSAKPEEMPYGMVFVQRGSFNMGANDQSITWAMQPTQKTVSIDAFWMDQTEITNGEYRQFVYWVRDSIVLTALARNEVEFGLDPEESEYYTLRYDPYDESKDPDTVLNWRARIPWNARWEYEMDDEEKGVFRAVNSVYFNGADKLYGKQLNSHKMIYYYKYVAYDQAARPGNSFDPNKASYNERATVTVDSSFFRDGKIVMHFARHILASGMYKKQTRQSDRLARLAAGVGKGVAFVRPQHTCTPMLRSSNEEVYAKVQVPLEQSITMLRTNGNANQYVYPDYLYYTGRVIDRPLPTQHCSMAVHSADKIAAHILHASKSIICINDVSMSGDKEADMRLKLHRAFESRFPGKSRFEK